MDRPLLLSLLLGALLLGICIAGCMTAPAPIAGHPVSPSPTAVLHSPDASRLNATIAQLDTYAERARLKWNVPGIAVAIVKDGEVVFARGYGVKTAGGSDPVGTKTVFQIGSTSKAFTAALVALEVESGRMNWTDPVVRYVPDFRMSDPWVTKEFTLTDALAQRSGLSEKWGQDLATLGYTRSELIHALRYAQPVTSFRSEYRYQNIPFMVAAAAVENTSGASWEENLRTRIFAPLNMTSASSRFADLLAEPDHVSCHMIGMLPNGTIGPVLTDPDWRFNAITDTLGPAGSINANVEDMAKWAIFQLGNGTFNGTRLMRPETLAYMHTPRTPITEEMTDASKSYYCQGWNYQEMNGTPPIVRHTGETLGNHAYIMLVPRENLGVVVLANEAGPSLPEDVGNMFYQQYFGVAPADSGAAGADPLEMVRAFFFPPKPVRPEHPTPPLPFERYAGTYANNVYGPATVAAVNGTLTLTLGKVPVTLYLSPWDGNTFSSTCPEWQWGPPYDGRVVFATGPDGAVRELSTTLVLQKLYNQNATFVRAGAA